MSLFVSEMVLSFVTKNCTHLLTATNTIVMLGTIFSRHLVNMDDMPIRISCVVECNHKPQ